MEKLLYLQNGVWKKKEMTKGLQCFDGTTFTTVSPSKAGTYKLTYNGTTFDFEEDTGRIERLDNTLFKDSINQSIVVPTNGCIPVFTTYSSFKAINLPSDDYDYYFTRNGLNKKTYDVKSTFGSSSNRGIVVANQNSFDFLEAATDGTYVVNYTNGDFSLLKTDSSGGRTARTIVMSTSDPSDVIKTGNFNSQSTSIYKTSDSVSLSVGKTYDIEITMDLICDDYEAAFSFTKADIPEYAISYRDSTIIMRTKLLASPLPYIRITGRAIITADTTELLLSFVRSGSNSIQHRINDFTITIVQL